jgi:N-acetylgalactosamine kinase
LVVACSLAYLRCLGMVLERDITRLALAGLLAESEQYVGTRGGGMDQAIILLGDAGAACKIDFFPIRVERVPLPSEHAFVVCHSLVKAEKTGDALHLYNAGPCLCRLITAMVARTISRQFGADIFIDRLGDLWNGHLCLMSSEVAALFAETFPAERMRLTAAAKYLGTSVERIREHWLGGLAEPADGFALKARARHQLTEYQRVQASRAALLEGVPGNLGELMNASHDSCARDYAISCPELDTLTGIAREAGALGSRLTGAGFGGCTVSLVAEDNVDAFTKTVQARYYDDYIAKRPHLDVRQPMFVAQAGPGAAYIE